MPPADLLLTYMNADTPRLCTNAARGRHLNSVHGVYLRPMCAARYGAAAGSLTSMTLLGAETVGRAYGGGMPKIEPKEADRLPVPAPALVETAAEPLKGIRPQIVGLLRAGKLLDAVALVDDVLLVGELGLSPTQLGVLRDAHAALTARRMARAPDVTVSR